MCRENYKRKENLSCKRCTGDSMMWLHLICRNVKGLLNFVRQRINLVDKRLIYSVQLSKTQLSFGLLKTRVCRSNSELKYQIGHKYLEAAPILKYEPLNSCIIVFSVRII